jgi:hypothetical protein
MKKIFFVLSLLLFIFSPFCFEVKAARVEKQNDVAVRGDFDLGPTSFSVEGEPGEIVKRTLQLTNRKGFAEKFLVEVEDFEGTGNVGQPIQLQGKESGRFGAKNWVAVELNEFILEHGERQYFDVTIRIPEKTDPGDHYASVLVSVAPKENEREDSQSTAPAVNIRSRVGTLFYIRVKGDTIEDGQLEEFKTDKKWYETGPVTFKTTFRNSGTVRLQPFGKIDIYNWRDKKVETIDIEPFNVLRDAVRQDIKKWENDDVLGYYKAKLVLNRGYGDIIEEAEAIFWIVSWKKLSLWSVIGVIILVLLILVRKKVSFSIKIESKKDKDDTEEKSEEKKE